MYNVYGSIDNVLVLLFVRMAPSAEWAVERSVEECPSIASTIFALPYLDYSEVA
jgi:hypothetical protein